MMFKKIYPHGLDTHVQHQKWEIDQKQQHFKEHQLHNRKIEIIHTFPQTLIAFTYQNKII